MKITVVLIGSFKQQIFSLFGSSLIMCTLSCFSTCVRNFIVKIVNYKYVQSVRLERKRLTSLQKSLQTQVNIFSVFKTGQLIAKSNLISKDFNFQIIFPVTRTTASASTVPRLSTFSASTSVASSATASSASPSGVTSTTTSTVRTLSATKKLQKTTVKLLVR